MPSISGLGLQKKLRAQGYAIPAMFITAFAERLIERRALNADAAAFD